MSTVEKQNWAHLFWNGWSRRSSRLAKVWRSLGDFIAGCPALMWAFYRSALDDR